MLELVLKVLQEIEKNGYRAYIVGGFVRDLLLDRPSGDIDITTNATPKALKEIFPEVSLDHQSYGAVTLFHKNTRFEITTFRKEHHYLDHRRPTEIEYVDTLEEDIVRRDFTVNTICMDANGQIVDLLDGRKDLEAREIVTVGDATTRFREDALRILRAVRFATTLEFSLSKDTIKGIRKCRRLLKALSYERKREELDKIFTSGHAEAGIHLLHSLGLDKDLELSHLKKVTAYDDLMGIWAVLDVIDRYPFTNNEKQLIEKIQQARRENNLAPMVLYRYGLYVNTVAGSLKGIAKKDILEAFERLPIKCQEDLAITSEEIMSCLEKEPGPYLKEVYEELILQVVTGKLLNQRDNLLDYCRKNFK